MKKISLIEVAMIAGMIIAIILLIRIYNTTKTEGYKCQTSPLVYAARKYGEVNNKEMVGTAQFLVENSPIVHFNKDNMTVEFPRSEVYYPPTWNFNFSLVN